MMNFAYDKDGIIATDRAPNSITVTAAYYQKFFLQYCAHKFENFIQRNWKWCVNIAPICCAISRWFIDHFIYHKKISIILFIMKKFLTFKMAIVVRIFSSFETFLSFFRIIFEEKITAIICDGNQSHKIESVRIPLTYRHCSIIYENKWNITLMRSFINFFSLFSCIGMDLYSLLHDLKAYRCFIIVHTSKSKLTHDCKIF